MKPAELREFLAESVAKWQLPDAWTFIEAVPRTSVGKFDKKVIRKWYADGELEVEPPGLSTSARFQSRRGARRAPGVGGGPADGVAVEVPSVGAVVGAGAGSAGVVWPGLGAWLDAGGDEPSGDTAEELLCAGGGRAARRGGRRPGG